MRATGFKSLTASKRDISLPHGSLRCALLRSINVPFAGCAISRSRPSGLKALLQLVDHIPYERNGQAALRAQCFVIERVEQFVQTRHVPAAAV